MSRTMADAYVEQRMRHIGATLRIGGWWNAWLDMWAYLGEAASYRWATWMQCIDDPTARLKKKRGVQS